MTTVKKPLSLEVSFKAFVSENPKSKHKDILCTVSYCRNSQTLDYEPLLLTNLSNLLKIPEFTPNSNDELQFIFKRVNSEFLGSISIPTDLFDVSSANEFSQWITLFDDPEDDLFDGTLGEDDEDVPRAFLSFKLVPKTIEKQPSNTHNSQSLAKASEEESSDSEDNEDEEEEDISQYINDDSKYKLERQIETEELVKELRGRLQSLTNPADLLRVAQEYEAKRGQVQEDILKRVFKSRDLYDEEGRVIDESKRLIELEQEVSLYKLENEKLTRNETNQKDVRQMSSKAEKQYEELLAKYKECLESHEKECKALVSENNELNKELLLMKENINKLNEQVVELKKANLEPKYKAELEKILLEKTKIKSQSLQKLIDDINNQRNILTQSLLSEKEQNKKLKEKVEELTLLYKKNMEETKNIEAEYLERTATHAGELNALNATITQNHSRLIELEHTVSDLNQENENLHAENEKLKEENQSLMESLRGMSKELKEAKKAKFEEVSQLTGKINENQLEFERLNNEIEDLKRDLEFSEVQNKKLMDMDYPGLLKQKEGQLNESERQRSKLQEELAETHRKYKQNVEELTRKIIENYEARQSIDAEDQDSSPRSPRQRVSLATLRRIESQHKQEILEREKKINELLYVVKTYKVSEQVIAERDKIIEELRRQIADLQEEIRRLREEKESLQQELFRLTEELIKQTKTNLDQLNTINRLCEDNKRLQQNLDSAIECIPPPHRESTKYVPVQGDKIDRKMSMFINNSKNLPLQFIRVGEGLYTFGTKKVAVKILNGKIVIRVGGGYLMIEEFLRLYTFSELKKLSDTAKANKKVTPPSSPKLLKKSMSNTDNPPTLIKKTTNKTDNEEEEEEEDSQTSNTKEEISSNIKPQISLTEKKDEMLLMTAQMKSALSPREGNSAKGKKTAGKATGTGDKKKGTKTSTTPQKKRYTLFKDKDEELVSSKKKGNDVMLEVTKGGSGVKYGEKKSADNAHLSPRNFASPPPSKRVLGKK